MIHRTMPGSLSNQSNKSLLKSLFMPIHPKLNLCVFTFESNESVMQVINTISLYINYKVTLSNKYNNKLNVNELMFWTEILIYPYSDNHLTLVVQSIRQHDKLIF